ncbi:hypothetical protein Lal_00016659 [Lupinus albus]|nr:hypothetical protein Lal_00016659 [Lupinus albus]
MGHGLLHRKYGFSKHTLSRAQPNGRFQGFLFSFITWWNGLQIGKFYRVRSEDSSDPSIRSSKRLNPSRSSNANLSPEICLVNQPGTNISTSYQKNSDIANHSSPKQSSQKMGVSNGDSVSKSNIHVDGNSDPNFLSPEMRKRHLGRIHSLMVQLSAGGAKQFEEQTMNGTSSILSDLFEEANILLNDDNINQDERFYVEEDQNKRNNVDMDMGLNEKEIMSCIKDETFESY